MCESTVTSFVINLATIGTCFHFLAPSEQFFWLGSGSKTFFGLTYVNVDNHLWFLEVRKPYVSLRKAYVSLRKAYVSLRKAYVSLRMC